MKTNADNSQSKKWISFGTLVLGAGTIYKPVSYTHLDVYKRQE